MRRDDPWTHLKRHTAARIAIGRAGGSAPTAELLAFRLAHARARDAVHGSLDFDALAQRIAALGLATHVVSSQVDQRATYLLRPDLGRALSDEGRARLAEVARTTNKPDLLVVVSDGLSAAAVEANAEPFLATLVPLARREQLTLGPVVFVRNGRVAIQDEIGALLNAGVALILLGERPGLGSADSLGAYFVHAPRAGLTDADRNCISNIRTGGIPPADAARKALYLMRLSLTRQVSGVHLKDDGGTLLDVEPSHMGRIEP